MTTYPSIGVVLGAQWGDEGKGKLTDILGEHYDVCARYNGGSNAGHTIVKNGVKYATHLLPSGILTDDMVSLIGNGVVVHFPTLWQELADLEKGGINWQGRLLISDRAHVVFEFHKIVDGRSEKALKGNALGTTGRGIGPTYAQKMERSGLRVHNLFEEDFGERFRRALSGWEARYGNLGIVAKNVDGTEKKDENGSPVIIPYDVGTVDAEIEYYLQMREKLRPMVVDCAEYLDHALAGGKRLLIESANAIMLDVDHGTYPYVTSSPPSIGGACTGLGLPATKLAKSPLIVGIVKAYTTRVGEGPFPTELDIFQENTAGWVFSTVGREKGTTTGRFRRCGWLDLPVVKYGHRVNGYTHLNLTKLDVLDGLEEIKICTEYHDKDGKVLTTVPASLVELANVVPQYVVLPGWKTSIAECKHFAELPVNAQNYVLFIQKAVGVHVKWVGVGAASSAIIEDVPF